MEWLLSDRKQGKMRNSPGKKKSSNKVSCSTDLVCSYGTFPIKEPMLIDNFDLKLKSNFLKNIEKVYYNVINKNPSSVIQGGSDKKNPKNFMRDTLTAYVVSNIFTKGDNQYKLIHIINTIIKSLYAEFYKKTGIECFFVYRGGNILKIYKSNFEKVLPGRAKKFVQSEFDEYFKNSDIDFYTVIKDAHKIPEEDLDRINQYVQMMNYYGIYIARIFIINNFNLFDFCRLNQVSLKEDFKDIVEILNSDKNNSDSNVVRETKIIGLGFNNKIYLDDRYNLEKILHYKHPEPYIPGQDDSSVQENFLKFGKTGRFDINVNPVDAAYVEMNRIDYKQPNLFTDNFQKYMDSIIRKNGILDFYISNNNMISDKEEEVEFGLSRLMINFMVVFERKGRIGFTNATSELFDLSLGHPRDKMYNVYSSENITKYPFRYDEDKTDEVYIPKIRTTLTDLIKILFDIEYPWLDSKYEKRLFRLLLLTFLEELSNSDIYKIEKILKSKKMRKFKSEDDITFETLNFRNDFLKKKSVGKQSLKYKEYIKKYQQIIYKLLNVVKKIKDFVKSKQQFNPKDVYEFSFDPLEK
jgi:hypothetical protein